MYQALSISSDSNHTLLDAQRRGRVQEALTVLVAVVILLVSFVIAARSVVDGTVSSTTRTERGALQCRDSAAIDMIAIGSTSTTQICPSGTP